MDYAAMFEESFQYVKEALWGKWVKWLLLVVCTIIFPLFLGYILEIMRGKKPAPELENWGKLFIDGIKVFIVALVYSIPAIVVLAIAIGASNIIGVLSPAAGFGSMIIGLIVFWVVAVVIALIAAFAPVRLARYNSIGEAFNFKAIVEHIGKIGWGSYIVALLIYLIAIGIVNFVIGSIPAIGSILNLLLTPAYGIFGARYITLIYDSVQSESL